VGRSLCSIRSCEFKQLRTKVCSDVCRIYLLTWRRISVDIPSYKRRHSCSMLTRRKSFSHSIRTVLLLPCTDLLSTAFRIQLLHHCTRRPASTSSSAPKRPNLLRISCVCGLARFVFRPRFHHQTRCSSTQIFSVRSCRAQKKATAVEVYGKMRAQRPRSAIAMAICAPECAICLPSRRSLKQCQLRQQT
jgi:hypothetical protein